MQNDLKILEEESNRQIIKSTDQTKEQKKHHSLNLSSKDETFKRRIEQEEFNLLKKNFDSD